MLAVPACHGSAASSSSNQVEGRRIACWDVLGWQRFSLKRSMWGVGGNSFKGDEVKLNSGFITRRKAHHFQCVSVLEKPIGKAGNTDSTGGNGHLNPAIAALERLIQQAQFQEERASDPNYGNGRGIEHTVSELELDLNIVLTALKAKEAELGEAEQTVRADQWDVQMTRSALVNREKELEAAYKSHSIKQEELQRAHEVFLSRNQALRNAEEVVSKNKAELEDAQKELAKKQDDLSKLQKQLLEKDNALEEVASKLTLKELELERAKDLLSTQAADTKSLEASLLEKDSDLGKMREDRDWKQDVLQKLEDELQERTKAWSSAQDDLRSLEQELASSKVRGKARLTELSQLKVLLTEVQAELSESQSTVANLRRSIDEQNKFIEHQEKDLASKRAMLASLEKNLESAQNVLEKEQEQTRLARLSYEALQEELRRGKEVNIELQAALASEKRRVQELTQELNVSKRLLQERDSLLSDTELSLQLTETELVGTKLELQNVKSELFSVKLALNQKDIQLQAAQESLKSLQEEVMHVRGLLQTKEDQLSKVSLLLREKEEEVAVLRVGLNDSHLQLNQATSVVEQITELSRALVGSSSRQEVLEESMLMRKTSELVTTKRALFESQLQIERLQEQFHDEELWQREINALKEALQKKDLQLLEAQTALASKDRELRALLSQWDGREQELIKLRQDVIDEAKVLSRVRMLQLQGLDGDTASQLLAGERAKLEAETAIDALRNLTNLSHNLVQECQPGTSFESRSDDASPAEEATQQHSGGFQGLESAEELGDLKNRLTERDAALEITKCAMAELTNLTKRLMKEAGVDDLSFHGAASAGSRSGSGTVVAAGKEVIESAISPEATANSRSGVVSEDGQVSPVEEADMVSDSSKEELITCRIGVIQSCGHYYASVQASQGACRKVWTRAFGKISVSSTRSHRHRPCSQKFANGASYPGRGEEITAQAHTLEAAEETSIHLLG